MKRCQEQRKLPENPFCTRGWMNEGWQRKDQGRVDYATDPEAKDRLWEETRADGGSLEAVRRVVLAPGPPGSLAPLPSRPRKRLRLLAPSLCGHLPSRSRRCAVRRACSTLRR